MSNPLHQPNQMGRGMVSPGMSQATGPVNQPAASGPMNMMQQMIFNKLYQSNPNFRRIADSVKDMGPEQAFQQYGLDYNQFRNVDMNQIRNMLGM